MIRTFYYMKQIDFIWIRTKCINYNMLNDCHYKVDQKTLFTQGRVTLFIDSFSQQSRLVKITIIQNTGKVE
jgi:hypothetical protein